MIIAYAAITHLISYMQTEDSCVILERYLLIPLFDSERKRGTAWPNGAKRKSSSSAEARGTAGGWVGRSVDGIQVYSLRRSMETKEEKPKEWLREKDQGATEVEEAER